MVDDVNPTYDAVVIGAGIAGLFAGNFLARKGVRTLLCEQHCTPGGYVCGFKRGGYYFDGGVHSFGSYGMLFPLLNELDLTDQVVFKPSRTRMVGPGFDFVIDSLEGVRDVFKTLYPEASIQLNSFFAELAEVLKASTLFEGFLLLSKLAQAKKLAGIMMKRKNRELLQKMSKWNNMKYPELINKHFKDHTELRQFFTQICYANAPLVAYGGMWQGYLSDYWYPTCGMQGFADRLAQNFLDLGGTIRYQSQVEKIITRNGEVTGVAIHDEGVINARYVISAGDYKNLIGTLLDEKDVEIDIKKKFAAAPVSESFVKVFLGIKRPAEEINRLLQAHQVFYYPNIRTSDARIGEDYFKDVGIDIISSTVENATPNKNGHTSLVIQTFADYQWMNCWGTGKEHKRNKEYQDLKNKVGMELIETLNRFIPGVKDDIEVMEVATPLTMERYTMNFGGASAGWNWDPDASPLKTNQFMTKTSTKNLLCCGHWIMSPGGVPSTALSGKWVADLVK